MYLAKFLDTSAKPFFPCSLNKKRMSSLTIDIRRVILIISLYIHEAFDPINKSSGENGTFLQTTISIKIVVDREARLVVTRYYNTSGSRVISTSSGG